MALRQLDPQYRDVVLALTEALRLEADAVITGNQGTDVAFGEVPSTVGPKFSIASLAFLDIHKGFARDSAAGGGIQAEYEKKCDLGTLTVQDATALASQNDILAGLEKAHQLRHKGRLAYLVSGTSRARGQASPNGFAGYALLKIPLSAEQNMGG